MKAKVTTSVQTIGGVPTVVITGTAAGISDSTTFPLAGNDTFSWLNTAYTYAQDICYGTGAWSDLNFGDTSKVYLLMTAIGGPNQWLNCY